MANKEYKIKGNKKIQNYDSDLDVDVDDQYEAYSKDITDNSTPIPGGAVTWFNNFGIREKSSGGDKDVTYTVRAQAPPEGKMLFVLIPGDPPVPQQLDTEPIGNSGKVRFTLSIGDPPIGLGP